MIPIKNVKKAVLTECGITSLDDLFHCFGEEIDNLYFHDKRGPFKFVYSNPKHYIFLPFTSVDLNSFRNFNYLEFIHNRQKDIKKHIENSEFEQLLFTVDKPFIFKAYQDNFHLIPDDEKYSCFRLAYLKAEYGFSELDRGFIYKILSYQTNKEFMKNLSFDDNGYLTIYRGESSRSNTVDKSFSWTLGKNIALFFANRFGEKNARLYKAKIHKDHIIDYITERNEKEIFLLPEHLMELEKLAI